MKFNLRANFEIDCEVAHMEEVNGRLELDVMVGDNNEFVVLPAGTWAIEGDRVVFDGTLKYGVVSFEYDPSLEEDRNVYGYTVA